MNKMHGRGTSRFLAAGLTYLGLVTGLSCRVRRDGIMDRRRATCVICCAMECGFIEYLSMSKFILQ